MVESKRSREQITTRIDPAARAAIDRAAEERQTTPAHVARILLESAVRELSREEAA
jgi:hypothetical protein